MRPRWPGQRTPTYRLMAAFSRGTVAAIGWVAALTACLSILHYFFGSLLSQVPFSDDRLPRKRREGTYPEFP